MTDMSKETWIIYKASPDAEGWFDRRLSDGSLTDIIAEELDWSGKMPKVGDRVRNYENLADPGNGATHGKDGDWVVTKILQFSNPDADFDIVVCRCDYQPISADWEELKRGKSVNDMLHTVKA
jgi:hypothetical protein